MSVTAADAHAPRRELAAPALCLARTARRLAGFYVFIACIALGVMSIAGVGSLAASLADGLAQQGQVILGGDLAFTLIQREASADELAFLQSHGTVSAAATLRAMARSDNGQATLVEMKAVDGAYPLYGAAELDPAGPLQGGACRTRRRLRRRRRSDADGAPQHQARRAHRRRQCQVRSARGARPANRTSSPAASALGRASW